MTALPLAIDTGDTAWLLAASALVLLMAPGLALFYGGMVRSKSVLNMIMMTFGTVVVCILWSLVGYSIAFVVSGIIGYAVHRNMGFRIDEEHEINGIDLIIHAETAYDLHATAGTRSGGGTGVLASLTHQEGAQSPQQEEDR